jgi:hypothetical protein
MWIFTLDGYFSAVQDKSDDRQIVVRSRIKADLERFLDRAYAPEPTIRPEILTGIGTDYAHRVFVPKWVWVEYVTEMAEEIDYSNFKAAAVPANDRDRSHAYYSVWNVLRTWQKDS